MGTTLLVMAAGMGSRYGGDKQIDRLGPNGEILMEYSIYDAMLAGFDKVVFVIKKGMYEAFRAQTGDRIAARIPVEYAFQEFDSLPEGFVVPEGRSKPYGTVHAVLCARDVIHEPFAVINADDYYGRDAFLTMRRSLEQLTDGQASMVAYALKNTVSEHGTVTRGICHVNADGYLNDVEETYKIGIRSDGEICDFAKDEGGRLLDREAMVSMNFWGFTPWLFEQGDAKFRKFLASASGNPMKCEYVLPTLVNDLMHDAHMTVDVLKTDAVWFGMTYREDRPIVVEHLRQMHDLGLYPDSLWNS